MKKNSFVKGAFIATMAIFITKFLGIVYVIPFYSIIGEENGALYSYAYTIYNLFLLLSCIGLPSAMAKLISEYNTLGYHYTKERAYKIGKTVVTILGIICFILLFTFAPFIANQILGAKATNNSINDIAFVVRIISTAILFVPSMSISRGYLQGHKYIEPTSYSQILEQVVRIIVILVGSYTFLNVFHLGVKNAVGIAVFGATIGAIASLIYIKSKINKNRQLLNVNSKPTEEEKKISTKEIIRKILKYSIPLVLFGITISVYEVIDMMTIVRTLTNTLDYTKEAAESIFSVLNTWGNKLNSIVISLSIGLTTSIIPSITSSFVSKNYNEVKRKVNQALQILFFIALPMTIGLSFLAEPVFNSFYGLSEWGPKIFKYSVFIAFVHSLFNVSVICGQSTNNYKTVYISLFSGILYKLIFNIPLILLFDKLSIGSYNGAITATIIGLSITILINLFALKKQIKINYKDTFKRLGKIFIALLLMIIVLIIMSLFINLHTNSRIISLLIIILYGIVGSTIYFYVVFKNKVIYEIFGNEFLTKIFKKLKITK